MRTMKLLGTTCAFGAQIGRRPFAMDRSMRAAEAGREWLRTTFDAAAELYDRVRPSYLPDLLDDLVGLAHICPSSRMLEIGCARAG